MKRISRFHCLDCGHETSSLHGATACLNARCYRCNGFLKKGAMPKEEMPRNRCRFCRRINSVSKAPYCRNCFDRLPSIVRQQLHASLCAAPTKEALSALYATYTVADSCLRRLTSSLGSVTLTSRPG